MKNNANSGKYELLLIRNYSILAQQICLLSPFLRFFALILAILLRSPGSLF